MAWQLGHHNFLGNHEVLFTLFGLSGCKNSPVYCKELYHFMCALKQYSVHRAKVPRKVPRKISRVPVIDQNKTNTERTRCPCLCYYGVLFS